MGGEEEKDERGREAAGEGKDAKTADNGAAGPAPDMAVAHGSEAGAVGVSTGEERRGEEAESSPFTRYQCNRASPAPLVLQLTELDRLSANGAAHHNTVAARCSSSAVLVEMIGSHPKFIFRLTLG